ncbi:MAG: GNAT family N-acetyltransferase [Lachnospiraceae bacterium]|nr:GNAT family N-acetyltransferase [Lachnospiraceae bacterium]
MNIRIANEFDFESVKRITQTTIKTVYPKYYPAGAVQFFCDHHSDEKILEDIKANRVYLIENEENEVGTVTICGNEINRLFVLTKYQHMGYGRALMDFAEKMISKETDTVVLDASLPAKKIYLLRGYKETAYNIIKTDNGDYLCFDVMERHIGGKE